MSSVNRFLCRGRGAKPSIFGIELGAALLLVVSCSFASAADTGKQVETVAADGSAQFRTVQEAIDAAPQGNVRIEIKPGEYRQVLHIDANGVELRGLGKSPENVVLIYDNSAGTAGGTGKSGTVTITGDDFHATNLTFANDFEKRHERSNEGSQAVAVRVTGDREVFRRVRFLGYQDTLYADSKSCHNGTDPCRASRQYFTDCYIEGHVDFIFGDAKALFERCTIHAMPHSMDTITAQSRLRLNEDSGYVFRDCTITGDPGTAGTGTPDVLLGRPWRAYSTVVFINTDFKVKLDPAGWKEWGDRLATSTYAEFNSRGLAGDTTQRIAPSRQLSAAEAAKYTVKDWLSPPDSWNPEAIK